MSIDLSAPTATCGLGRDCGWYRVAQEYAASNEVLRETAGPMPAVASDDMLVVRSEVRRLKAALQKYEDWLAAYEGRPVAGGGGPVLPQLAGRAASLDDHVDDVVRSLGLAPHPTACQRCNGDGVVVYRSLVAPDPKLIHCPDCRCPCGKPVVGGGMCPPCAIFDGIDADVAFARSQGQ
jgi:hypothetical protein